MNATLTPPREFIEFLLGSGVLSFGDFQTKSGRRTPYFMDFARFSRGSEVRRLGNFYAAAIHARLGDAFDVLFGPAYKGIPLVVATSMALANEHERDVSFCFNRKEEKDHGEGGRLVGHKLVEGERVVIVEDVTTAGTSIRETVPLLRAAKARLAGLVVAVDRQERGNGERSALRELEEEFQMPCFAIATIDEIVASLSAEPLPGRPHMEGELLERIQAYRSRYGGK